MGSDVVIRAERLGKKYVIGHQSTERYTALRDVLARSGKNFVRIARDMFSGKALVAGDELEEFWALKDVSFDINRGDVIGIIGRNGAGKSTLLKVLSRITEPSAGRVEIKGRVASLLEVGTGFHPELTGRENIYQNGAILGMSRAEIRCKFDEIVDFSGVEKFLDTPVKRYSSGMYVRLAFAVAAHLEPEILIVDEVLAVGDAEFQKKCLGKMQDVAGHGRTVLFVSHNMGSMATLCSHGIVLSEGQVRFLGDIQGSLDAYRTITDKEVSGQISIGNSRFSLSLGTSHALRGDKITMLLSLLTAAGHHLSEIGITLHNSNMTRVAVIDARQWLAHQSHQPKLSLSVTVNTTHLNEDVYYVGLYVEIDGQKHQHDIVERLTILEPDANTPIPPFPRHVRGTTALEYELSSAR